MNERTALASNETVRILLQDRIEDSEFWRTEWTIFGLLAISMLLVA